MNDNLMSDYCMIIALSQLGSSLWINSFYISKYGEPYSEKLDSEITRAQLKAYGTIYNLH